MVAAAPFPEVFSPADRPGDVGAPPQLVLSPAADARVRNAVVRVEGQACSEIQDGSGFAVARNLIVTNAHVVAGEHETFVFLPDGDKLRPGSSASTPRATWPSCRCRTSASPRCRSGTRRPG